MYDRIITVSRVVFFPGTVSFRTNRGTAMEKSSAHHTAQRNWLIGILALAMITGCDISTVIHDWNFVLCHFGRQMMGQCQGTCNFRVNMVDEANRPLHPYFPNRFEFSLFDKRTPNHPINRFNVILDPSARTPILPMPCLRVCDRSSVDYFRNLLGYNVTAWDIRTSDPACTPQCAFIAPSGAAWTLKFDRSTNCVMELLVPTRRISCVDC